jgi:hypoxanthine phosphoribosyltransferase
VILCVMLGGLVPTAEIVRRLSFPFELDYLHATRYRGETAGRELIWKVSPEIPLIDRQVLVIDDILDEGATLESILRALDAQGPASVRTAILLEKEHERRDPALGVDYLGGRVPDRYVFGAGMDYRGYFRQLPAVYAVRDF